MTYKAADPIIREIIKFEIAKINYKIDNLKDLKKELESML